MSSNQRSENTQLEGCVGSQNFDQVGSLEVTRGKVPSQDFQLSRQKKIATAMLVSELQAKLGMPLGKEFGAIAAFIQEENPASPLSTFEDLGMTLCGPFELLINGCGSKDRAQLHLQDREFFHSPEMQCIARGRLLTWSYWRDSPKSDPDFVVSSKRDTARVVICGDSLLSILLTLAEGEMKEKLLNLASTFDLPTGNSAKGKRKKESFGDTFNGIGVKVPYNKKTELGYRPLSKSRRDLNTIFKNVAANRRSPTEAGKKQEGELQEVMRWSDIANDEMDFGNGLELGINLFCHEDSEMFHKEIMNHLELAYILLSRQLFAEILTAHVAIRAKPKPSKRGLEGATSAPRPKKKKRRQ